MIRRSNNNILDFDGSVVFFYYLGRSSAQRDLREANLLMTLVLKSVHSAIYFLRVDKTTSTLSLRAYCWVGKFLFFLKYYSLCASDDDTGVARTISINLQMFESSSTNLVCFTKVKKLISSFKLKKTNKTNMSFPYTIFSSQSKVKTKDFK